MEPIEFPEANVTFAKDQPEYNPLPCLRTENGQLLICWKLSWRERLKVLMTGVIWHTISTFGQNLQPQLMEADKPVLTYQPEPEPEVADDRKERDDLDKQRAIAAYEARKAARGRSYNIPIAGLDPALVLAALFNAAKPDASGKSLAELAGEVMTREDAHAYLTDLLHTPGRNQYVDVIKGRIIGCHLGRNFINPQRYDEANGHDWAIKALLPLLPSHAVELAGFPLS